MTAGVASILAVLSALLMPWMGDLTAAHLSGIAAKDDTRIVFTAEQPCGVEPRPGVWIPELGESDYLGVRGCFHDETPGVVYLSPAGALTRWGEISHAAQEAWLYVLEHELSHAEIQARCGTARPPGVDAEMLADAWMVHARGFIPGGFTYGYTEVEKDISLEIWKGNCPSE